MEKPNYIYKKKNKYNQFFSNEIIQKSEEKFFKKKPSNPNITLSRQSMLVRYSKIIEVNKEMELFGKSWITNILYIQWLLLKQYKSFVRFFSDKKLNFKLKFKYLKYFFFSNFFFKRNKCSKITNNSLVSPCIF